MKALLIFLALFVLLLHTSLSIRKHDGPNEKILAKSVESETKGGVSIRYDYLDGILEGTVSTEEERQEMRRTARKSRAAGRIFNHIKVADQPASFFAGLVDNQLTLSGVVANQSIKDRITSAAEQLRKGDVIDELKINPQVEPTEWATEMPEFLSNFYEDIDSGEIEVSASQLRLKRGVRAYARKQDLLKSVADWDVSLNDQVKQISDQPSYMLASLNDNALTLTGTVPSDYIRQVLDKEARQSGFQVSNRIEVREDAIPPNWTKNLDGFMGNFFREATTGELEVDNSNIRLNRAFSELKAKDSWSERARAVFPKGQLINELKFQPPPENRPAFMIATLKDNRMQVSGEVPDTKVKQELYKVVAEQLPDVNLIDNLRVTDSQASNTSWNREIVPLFRDFFSRQTQEAEFEINAENLRLKKMVGSQSSKYQLLTKAKSIMPNRTIDQLTIAPSQPARVLAVLRSNVLTLSGEVPSATLKNSLIRTATKTLPESKVVNLLEVDEKNTQIPAWSASVDRMLAEFLFAKPASAEFEIDPKKLRLRQEMADEVALGNMLTKAKRFMPGEVINQLTIRPPILPTATAPTKILAILADDSIDITGQVPSSLLKESINTQVNRSLPNVRINNLLKVDSSIKKAPWNDEVAGLLGTFLNSSKAAEFEIEPDRLRMKQILPNQASKDLLKSRALQLMPDDLFVDQLRVNQNIPLAPVYSETIQNFVIYFDTGKSWADWKGQQTLKDAASQIKNVTGNPSILVKGFADSSGNVAANQALSEKRARWVVDELESNSVNRQRIKFLGVGANETRTDGENWKDRRVEVSIVR